MNGDTFSASDWQAELDNQVKSQLLGKRLQHSFNPPPAQAYSIVKARDAGVQWCDIMAYCKSRGWEGSETTMLKFYRQQKGK